MNQIEQILFDLLIPMVQEKDSLQVKNMPSINDDEIIPRRAAQADGCRRKFLC